jgi:hypothetical protein
MLNFRTSGHPGARTIPSPHAQSGRFMPKTGGPCPAPVTFPMCHAEVAMRDPEIIETELMEISAIADDTIKLERIIAWCATHPDEVPFALHQFMGRSHKRPPETSKTQTS